MVKNLLAVWETQDGLLNLEDPLEKRMATHSSILAWRIPWTEGLQSWIPPSDEHFRATLRSGS